MATLGKRILWRAVPVGLATAVVGYALLNIALSAARAITGAEIEQGDSGGQIQGVIIFGLIGFALAAGLECVRREKVAKP